LHERGVIEKGRQDIHESIIKAGRLARNVFSHDIKVFPTLSEAHSLLGEALRILEIVIKVLEVGNHNSESKIAVPKRKK
jgi:hypothetical protein